MDDLRTYTWLATPGSAADAARSFARGNVRRRRGLLVGLWLLATVLMWTGLDEGPQPLARVFWALVYAGVVVAVALPVGLLAGRHLTRRRFAARLSPGTELTSRFTPSSVELTGPLSRHELSYDGLVHVERVEGWVHLRQLGSPVCLVWPGDLFPDAELDRMRAAIAARSS